MEKWMKGRYMANQKRLSVGTGVPAPRGRGIVMLILLVLVVALVVLYFVGRKAQRRQIAQKEQMDAVAQTVSMLIIDKKKLRLSQSGLPEQVIEQTPKLLRRNILLGAFVGG